MYLYSGISNALNTDFHIEMRVKCISTKKCAALIMLQNYRINDLFEYIKDFQGISFSLCNVGNCSARVFLFLELIILRHD